jgi:hypothetical protein
MAITSTNPEPAVWRGMQTPTRLLFSSVYKLLSENVQRRNSIVNKFEDFSIRHQLAEDVAIKQLTCRRCLHQIINL